MSSSRNSPDPSDSGDYGQDSILDLSERERIMSEALERIVVDRPGMGESVFNGAAHGMQRIAQDALRRADQLRGAVSSERGQNRASDGTDTSGGAA